jgi:predicted  nucleic acid-binding Zn-ribbon protein
MAEVNNEPIYEVLKKLQADVAGLKDVWIENTAALNAIRTHMIAQSQDIQNIYSVMARHDVRLAHIESRLEIVEPV